MTTPESPLASPFAAQRQAQADGVLTVQQCQASAQATLAAWPATTRLVREGVLPGLAARTAQLQAAGPVVKLRALDRPRRRLAWLERWLWLQPHLVAVRVRIVGLWFVAYRRELAGALLALALLAVMALAVGWALANQALLAAAWRELVLRLQQP